MTLYEELDKQKERIQELMESKAKIIEQCQAEIKRVDAKYNVEIGKQATDICSLVERIDSEIELLKLFFEKNLILLQNTVESDKKIIAQTASKKWSTYFETMLENEEKNFINTKEQRILYSKSIQKITEQQDKILRSMRIRLDKNSEMLEWELQNTKGNVLMNSEKLDYNYQVLLKKNDENNIIHTQQKRRVARLNESLCMVKQKISNFDFNKKCHCTKLTADIKKLHYFISELEKKLACVKESYTNKVGNFAHSKTLYFK